MISVLFVNTVTLLFYIAFERLIKKEVSIYSKIMVVIGCYCSAYYLACLVKVVV